MLIRRMTAVFGKLQGQTLELNNGLNIIQAPNETGKSTWCAFILAMLYGINSRERGKTGTPADKTRYAPWNGAAMSGRMDCESEGQNITLLRTTKRTTAPMGEFQALHTNTNDNISTLSPSFCGEQLLGVTREVYARSAFIRQNNLGITQNAELERRIASLLSSGEESTSYSEASDILKKQLHQRRHNRTGQIPALETELQQLHKQLEEAEALSSKILSLRQQEHALLQEESSLHQELQRIIAQEENQANILIESKASADDELRRADVLRQQLEADHIPENETISRLRGAIVNLNTSHHALKKAREVRDEAMKHLLRAEDALSKNPFAGQTPEHAQKFACDAAIISPSTKMLITFMILGLAAIAWGMIDPLHFGTLSRAGIPLGLVAATVPLIKRRKCARNLHHILKKHGVSTPTDLRTLADEYAELVSAREVAQENLNKHSESADTLYNSISSNEQAILLEIRRFAPTAHDLSTADALLRGCAIRRKELAAAEQAARSALANHDAASQTLQSELAQTGELAKKRLHLEAELNHVSDTLYTCRKTATHLTGQLSAIGDLPQLHADIEHATQQLEMLQNEYLSLQTALDALDAANQTLQNRFAPALGHRTAQLFNYLTQGKYNNVVLDRNFRLAAEPEKDHVYRDISLLSAGAADQLYLATRLAICETILPKEKNAPLVLDDALANFDDERCIAALRLLKELSHNRQILLFTCHSREAAYFANDRDVTILRLTNDVEKV